MIGRKMDDKTKRKTRRGISLRNFNIILFLLALIITAVMFVTMKKTSDLYNETRDITQQVVELRQSAYDMQLASDYLTEQIRCFAVTGETGYLENYFREANETKRREKALETIRKYEGETVAFESLNEAMMGSLDLMSVEYYSALLTLDYCGINRSQFPDIPSSIELSRRDREKSAEEKRQEAINMLFDNTYRSKKEYISGNMQKCLTEIAESMGKEQTELADSLNSQVYLEHVLTELLIAIMLGIVIASTILVINPLMKMVEIIREGKPAPVKGAHEVRFLAKTYNLTYYTNVENQKKLEYDASHDKLTGMFNRRGYDLLMSNIDIESSALLLVDLDNFKQVNDNCGHDVGDRELVRVSDMLMKSFRSYGYCCRTGGDEFAVILVHTDGATRSMVEKKIKKMNEKLSKPAKGVPAVSVSAGMAFGRSSMDAERLFKFADNALYEVKKHGRSDIHIAG